MDTAEFTEILRKHAGLIHRIAYAYCRDRTDREDVVQEIAAQLWRSRERYDERYRHTTWIYRIALNVAISLHRREHRNRRRAHPLEEERFFIESVEPSEEMELLLSAIDALNALERALVLLYLDGNNHTEIGEVLGISVSNVGTKLARIKTKLRTAVDAPPCKESVHGIG